MTLEMLQQREICDKVVVLDRSILGLTFTVKVLQAGAKQREG